jgi:hypothetical protein
MSQSTEPKVTEHASANIGQPDEGDYGKEPFWQFDEVKMALFKHVSLPGWGRGISDLRGRTFNVTVAEDGLHVTVEEVVK